MHIPGYRELVAVLGVATVLAALSRADEVLTLATTTSTENSGLLAHLHPDFEKKTGTTVKVIAKGTGASLQLAREGNADVILVHARAMEDEFVSQGYGINRRDVMYNDFVIIGPEGDPAGLKGRGDAAEALSAIHRAQREFVSRGDNSGTHVKEQELWREAKVELVETETRIIKKGKPVSFRTLRPVGDWYLSIGQGMGKTIHYATEKRAYTLADRGTYYAYALGDDAKTDLVILCEGDKRLANPYGVIAVNPDKFPHLNHKAAAEYIRWLTSPETQKRIGEYRKAGKVLFHPAARP